MLIRIGAYLKTENLQKRKQIETRIIESSAANKPLAVSAVWIKKENNHNV
jgi:hypothetical protein